MRCSAPRGPRLGATAASPLPAAPGRPRVRDDRGQLVPRVLVGQLRHIGELGDVGDGAVVGGTRLGACGHASNPSQRRGRAVVRTGDRAYPKSPRATRRRSSSSRRTSSRDTTTRPSRRCTTACAFEGRLGGEASGRERRDGAHRPPRGRRGRTSGRGTGRAERRQLPLPRHQGDGVGHHRAGPEREQDVALVVEAAAERPRGPRDCLSGAASRPGVGDHPAPGVGRRRCAPVGDEVEQRGVDVVPDRADHRSARRRRPQQRLVGERQQLLGGPPAPRDDDDVDLRVGVQP